MKGVFIVVLVLSLLILISVTEAAPYKSISTCVGDPLFPSCVANAIFQNIFSQTATFINLTVLDTLTVSNYTVINQTTLNTLEILLNGTNILDLVLLLGTSNDPLTGTLDMGGNNITNLSVLELTDGSQIKQGNPTPAFSGFDNAIVIFVNESIPEGEVAFAVLTFDNKTLIALQVGEPEAAGKWRNSLIVSGDFNRTNATELTSCPIFFSDTGITQRVGCNTSTLGANFILQHSAQLGGIIFTEEGAAFQQFLTVIGRGGDDIDFVNTSIHILQTRIEETGFATGEVATLLVDEFAEDVIEPFIRTSSGGGIAEWSGIFDTGRCQQEFCARAAGGSQSPNRVMETNISTIDFAIDNFSFFLTTENLDSGDVFNVSLDDNAGTVVKVFEITDGTDATNNFTILDVPTSMDDKAVVTIKFLFSANNANEQVWVDLTKLNATATANTKANITRFDAEILLGDGDQRIFWNDSTDTLELPGNISFKNVIEESANITTKITLVNETIFTWSDISNFDHNVLLTNGSRAMFGDFQMIKDNPQMVINSTGSDGPSIALGTTTGSNPAAWIIKRLIAGGDLVFANGNENNIFFSMTTKGGFSAVEMNATDMNVTRNLTVQDLKVKDSVVIDGNTTIIEDLDVNGSIIGDQYSICFNDNVARTATTFTKVGNTFVDADNGIYQHRNASIVAVSFSVDITLATLGEMRTEVLGTFGFGLETFVQVSFKASDGVNHRIMFREYPRGEHLIQRNTTWGIRNIESGTMGWDDFIGCVYLVYEG